MFGAMEWKVDLHEVDGIRRWYGKQPRLLRVATGNMLNDFAFGTRTAAIQQINRHMTVRNARFVASRIRVTKANRYLPVNNQVAWTGSVAGPRFSGWAEQEKGAKTKRNRFSTLAGRGGSVQKQMRPSVRLKPKNEVISPSDYHPRGGDRNISGFVQMVLRKKETRIIRIKGTFYKRKRNRLEQVQGSKPVQPKKFRWLRNARATYFRNTDLTALWRRHCMAVTRPPSKL